MMVYEMLNLKKKFAALSKILPRHTNLNDKSLCNLASLKLAH